MVCTYISVQISPTLVSFAAVFRDVRQRSPKGPFGALTDRATNDAVDNWFQFFSELLWYQCWYLVYTSTFLWV